MDEFIEQLLTESGLPENVDPAVRSRLKSELTERATKLINRRLVESLSQKDAEQLSQLLEQNPGDQQVFQAFIDQHVDNKRQIAADALLELRRVFLGEGA